VTLPKISGNEDKDELQKWKERALRLEKEVQSMREELAALSEKQATQ